MSTRNHATKLGSISTLSLLAAAGVALSSAAPSEGAVAEGAPVQVTVTDRGCVPNSISVQAGTSVFKIKNASTRAVEWEILKGVMVVEERENIIPGFEQSLTATLDAGDYAMTCGRLSNPRGILKVVATAGAVAKPSPMDLVGPIAEYKVYVSRQIDQLVAETKKFTEAVKAGKLEDAKKYYAPARVHYERIEPIAELFKDLDDAMDVREDDFEKKAADPKFTGFHRIEKGLFADNTTDGLAPLAEKLMSDTLDLQKRVATLTITPKNMVGGAAELIEEVASKKIAGEEDRYSRTDLYDFNSNIEGAKKIVELLRPLIQKQDAKLDGRVEENFKKVEALLAKYKTRGGGFESYDKLSPTDRTALKGPVTVLAEDLSKLRGTLGID